MSHFYNKETCGKFPGERTDIALRTRRTFPYFVFWSGLLAVTLASAKGRAIYLRLWSIMGLSSVLYMATLYDWIQA